LGRSAQLADNSGVAIATGQFFLMKSGQLRLRITKTLSGSIDGIQLGRFKAGYVYYVGPTLGTYLLSLGAAEPVADDTPASILAPDQLMFGPLNPEKPAFTFDRHFDLVVDNERSEAADHPRRRTRKRGPSTK
jgi:hypothetical protein